MSDTHDCSTGSASADWGVTSWPAVERVEPPIMDDSQPTRAPASAAVSRLLLNNIS